MCKDSCRKFHSNSDIHTIRIRINTQILTDIFHPFTSTASCGNNTFFTIIIGIFMIDSISAIQFFYFINETIEMKINLFFQMII